MTTQDAGMTQSSVRSANLASVLGRIVANSGSISRADIAHQLGMTRSTVSRLVDDLVIGQLVEEGETVAGARGRPAVPLGLRGGTVISLGLEVNVERLVATVVDLRGEVRSVAQRDVDVVAMTPAEAMTALAALAEEALREEAGEDVRVSGAVLALPGLLDRDGRRVLRAPNLGWEGAEPPALWDFTFNGERIDLHAANDIDCSALTVIREDPGGSFLYVTGEVGIGSAVALDGRLMTGRHGWAGELGHVCVDPDGALCGCGANGCLETVAGARFLLAAAGQPTMDALVEAAASGDPRTLAAIEHAARSLGIALGAALNLLDVSTVRLGGHLGVLEPWLSGPLGDELGVRVMWARHSGIEVETVSEAPLRSAKGAGLAAQSGVLTDPAGWIAPLVER